MIRGITWTYISVWNHSCPSEVPYSVNQYLVRNFFCCFLQQTGSSKCSLISVIICVYFSDLTHFRTQGRNLSKIQFAFWAMEFEEKLILRFTDLQWSLYLKPQWFVLHQTSQHNFSLNDFFSFLFHQIDHSPKCIVHCAI